jgi:hypothetical protein
MVKSQNTDWFPWMLAFGVSANCDIVSFHKIAWCCHGKVNEHDGLQMYK